MKTLFLYTLFLLFPPYKMYFLKIFSVPLSLPQSLLPYNSLLEKFSFCLHISSTFFVFLKDLHHLFLDNYQIFPFFLSGILIHYLHFIPSSYLSMWLEQTHHSLLSFHVLNSVKNHSQLGILLSFYFRMWNVCKPKYLPILKYFTLFLIHERHSCCCSGTEFLEYSSFALLIYI